MDSSSTTKAVKCKCGSMSNIMIFVKHPTVWNSTKCWMTLDSINFVCPPILYRLIRQNIVDSYSCDWYTNYPPATLPPNAVFILWIFFFAQRSLLQNTRTDTWDSFNRIEKYSAICGSWTWSQIFLHMHPSNRCAPGQPCDLCRRADAILETAILVNVVHDHSVEHKVFGEVKKLLQIHIPHNRNSAISRTRFSDLPRRTSMVSSSSTFSSKQSLDRNTSRHR